MSDDSIENVTKAQSQLGGVLMTVFAMKDPDPEVLERARVELPGALQNPNGTIISALVELDARLSKLESER